MSNNTVIITAPQKSTVAAYVLWFFLGGFGIHKFYLRQNLAGAVYLGLYALGWLSDLRSADSPNAPTLAQRGEGW
jgi:TM2 domain-containing membrane protein YozV